MSIEVVEFINTHPLTVILSTSVITILLTITIIEAATGDNDE